MVLVRVQEHLETVVTLDIALYAHIDRSDDNIIYCFCGTQFHEHCRTREPREEDCGRCGTTVDLVFQVPHPCDERGIVCYLGGCQASDGALKHDLYTSC